MVERAPNVLQGRAHLYLKAQLVKQGNVRVVYHGFRQRADVVQRVVAETIEPVQFALVDGIAPVHFENLIDDGGHFIHIVTIERHHAHSHDVGHVVERVVFGTLQFQFAGQRQFCLDAVLQGNHRHMLFLQGLAQRL